MTLFVAILIVLYLSTFVAGQILLKQAMLATKTSKWIERPVLAPLVTAIVAMAASFFIKLGLLQRFELSYLFPFQGLTVIAVAAASAMLLRERVTARFWAGAAMVGGGVVMVSTT